MKRALSSLALALCAQCAAARRTAVQSAPIAAYAATDAASEAAVVEARPEPRRSVTSLRCTARSLPTTTATIAQAPSTTSLRADYDRRPGASLHVLESVRSPQRVELRWVSDLAPMQSAVLLRAVPDAPAPPTRLWSILDRAGEGSLLAARCPVDPPSTEAPCLLALLQPIGAPFVTELSLRRALVAYEGTRAFALVTSTNGEAHTLERCVRACDPWQRTNDARADGAYVDGASRGLVHREGPRLSLGESNFLIPSSPAHCSPSAHGDIAIDGTITLETLGRWTYQTTVHLAIDGSELCVRSIDGALLDSLLRGSISVRPEALMLRGFAHTPTGPTFVECFAASDGASVDSGRAYTRAATDSDGSAGAASTTLATRR